MFTKGSRYRNLPQSTSLTAEGEHISGVDLRVIPARPGNFQHTVQDGDRLDLLAYKYYNDSTRWWQINDANPALAFPNDLVDFSPIVVEEFPLFHSDFETRYQELLEDLGAIGSVATEEHDFVDAVVVLIYGGSSAARQQILSAILARGFNLLNSSQSDAGLQVAEAFEFDDHEVKRAWRELLEGLGSLPGILAIHSSLAETTLTLVFNAAMVTELAISNLIAARGFTTGSPPVDFSRTGKGLVIPPNRIG